MLRKKTLKHQKTLYLAVNHEGSLPEVFAVKDELWNLHVFVLEV